MNRGAIFLIAKTLNVQSLLLICSVQAYVFKKKLFPKPPSFVGESFKSQIEMFHIIMSPSLGFKRLRYSGKELTQLLKEVSSHVSRRKK